MAEASDTSAERPGDLLSPTLGHHRPREAGARAPWTLSSQVYVAFFGGALAVTAIAYLNSGRLRMPRPARHTILLIGLASFAAVLVVASLIGGDNDSPRGLQVAVQLVAVAGWGLMFLVQRPYERIFETFEDDEHDSLWVPGLIAVLALGLVQLLAVALAVG